MSERACLMMLQGSPHEMQVKSKQTWASFIGWRTATWCIHYFKVCRLAQLLCIVPSLCVYLPVGYRQDLLELTRNIL